MQNTKTLILFSVIAALITVGESAKVQGIYPNVTQLATAYRVHWKVEGDEIFIGLEVQTIGWIGFGIAEQTSGSMPGADMLIGIVDKDEGKATIYDRHATAKATPHLDECNHWHLLNADESDGVTVVEVKRKLRTDDPQDREIPAGNVKVVWAYGITDNFGYHGSNRRASSIHFYGPTLEGDISGPDVKTVDLLMGNYAIPAADTTYSCRTFELPIETYDQHIIAIEPIIQTNTAAYVHHFGLLWCREREDPWYDNHLNASDCWAGGASRTCQVTMYGWGPGSGIFVLPDNVGFLMSESKIRYLALQVHYDNPQLHTGLADNSGVRVYYTDVLRPQNAGSLALGDYAVDSPEIPAGQSNYHREYECPSECTSNWPHSITVFGVFSHAHMINRRFYTSLWRPSASTPFQGLLTRTDFFDFNFQNSGPINSVEIQPGDRLNTHCFWDSTARTEPTRFGPSSTDEMCLEILYYYPEFPDFFNCGYSRNRNTGVVQTMCGSRENLINMTNPSQPDPIEILDIKFGIADESLTCPQTVASLDIEKNAAQIFIINSLLLITMIVITLI